MFDPVTGLDFENANTQLDVAEAILKRLELSQAVQGTITRWHWGIPCVTFEWSLDGIQRNVCIVLSDLTPNFNVEASAWIDNESLKLRRWTYIPDPEMLTIEKVEQATLSLYEQIKGKTDTDLKRLSRLS
jgi:hypothetical protein